MRSRVCGVCGQSFRADTLAEVMQALEEHRRTHPAMPEAGFAPLERAPTSSARVDLMAEVHLEFEGIKQARRAGYSITHDSLFIPVDYPRNIGTRMVIKLAAMGRRYNLQGVVVAAYPDPANPQPITGKRGNGVFITSASPGWSSFCDAFASEFDEPTQPDAPLREAVRFGTAEHIPDDEWDDADSSS